MYTDTAVTVGRGRSGVLTYRTRSMRWREKKPNTETATTLSAQPAGLGRFARDNKEAAVTRDKMVAAVGLAGAARRRASCW